MQAVNVTYHIYQYTELDSSVKERVRQLYIQGQEPDFFKENVVNDLLWDWGVELDTHFSLSYCQGDGLCLFGSIPFSAIHKNKKLSEALLQGFDQNDTAILHELERYGYDSILLKKTSSSYNHANTVTVEVGEWANWYRWEHDAKTERLHRRDRTSIKLLRNTLAWYFSRCAEYEKWGYSYFYEITDADLADWCEANDYWFHKDGGLFIHAIQPAA